MRPVPPLRPWLSGRLWSGHAGPAGGSAPLASEAAPDRAAWPVPGRCTAAARLVRPGGALARFSADRLPRPAATIGDQSTAPVRMTAAAPCLRIAPAALACVLAAGLWAGDARAEPLGCLIEPDRVAEVGSHSIGVIERLQVERGDIVRVGQLLARLGAQVERAAVSVAEGRARADAEVQAAAAAHQLAVSKLRRNRDLLQQQFVSPLAVEQAEAEERVAAHRVSQAREAQAVARRELGLSHAQLGQRDVRSPFDGIVVERYRTEGERVEREPIVRIARIDPLRVEVLVPSTHFGRIQPGQRFQVQPELAQLPALQARVTLVDRVIDPASNSFRVRLALPNPDLTVPAGLRCRIDLSSPAQPAGDDPAARGAERVSAGPGAAPARQAGTATGMSSAAVAARATAPVSSAAPAPMAVPMPASLAAPARMPAQATAHATAATTAATRAATAAATTARAQAPLVDGWRTSRLWPGVLLGRPRPGSHGDGPAPASLPAPSPTVLAKATAAAKRSVPAAAAAPAPTPGGPTGRRPTVHVALR